MTDALRPERRGKARVMFESLATVSVTGRDIAASMKNISERGLFCFTDLNFEVGREIDVQVMLPEEVGLPLSGMVCCHGRVVRSEASGGQYGLAIEIQRLTPISPASFGK